ncbi:CDP-diacylglycerol--serine O-phosphatidyltransferase [Rhodobacteraceae bacterium 2376]|uniref:CDP-diacylglycerol--serine O-phosphatidyltransferase n=1 Tax=Rhabdonatronobacter sediminivivens TaxID=2743469 RepID=A0A7Z0HYB9_9RHOB|nr:CDP-diacylglycerol--serine O-phosphatidyltransferase [Rhabdonatronobacter sediminivivens]NYS24302.1 CDP-diacylglycerol--serine O-phosphatidyltransferase [Rhabdonatronobacter sediminivivens]
MTPPERRPLSRNLSLVRLMPNLVTILGLCAGLSAIRFTLDARFEVAAALIIFAALLDAVDGLVARRLNAASDFGAELDSLADFVNFGVAPGVLVFGYALQADFAGPGWIFVLVFAVCACLRLARFNINRDSPKSKGRQFFTGVPAPAGAMLGLFPVFLGLAHLAEPQKAPLLVAIWLAAVGLLMVSTLPTPSIKGLWVPREKAPYLLIATAFLVGLGITRFWLLMVLVILVYLVTIATVALWQRRSG